MARKPAAPLPPTEHRRRGFEPAFSLMTKQLRHAGEARGFAVSRLITHWPETVGEEVARVTRPVKIGWAREGMGASLTLLVNGAYAPMISMQLEKIRDKVNAVYGYNAISRIILTQTAAAGFAEGQAQFTAAPKPPPDPVAEAKLSAEAATKAEGISDPGLRSALEMLARNILSRSDRT